MYPDPDILTLRAEVNGGHDIIIVRGRTMLTYDHSCSRVALLKIEFGKTEGLLRRRQCFAEPHVSDEAGPFIFGPAGVPLFAVEVHLGGGRRKFAHAGATRQKGCKYQGQVGEE